MLGSTPAKRWRSILPRALALVLVTLLIAVTGWRLLGAHSDSASAPRRAAPGSFTPSQSQWTALQVADVNAHSFRSTVIAEGSIAYDEDAQTPVFSPYSGRVTHVVAKLGDHVARGAALMKIAATEFVQGQSDIASARAAYDNAHAAEQRQHALYDAGAAALKDWRQAQADLVAAQATLNTAQGRLRILGKTADEIAALEKGPAGETEAAVLAPISGTVTQRQVGLGQYLAAGGDTPAFTISDTSKVWLVAQVREADAPAVRVGQSAEVRVAALPGRVFKATVASVGAALDPSTHRLPVRARVDNPEGLLKAAMFAEFCIAVSETTDAPAVPESAIVYEGEEARVFVVNADKSVSLRHIRVGRKDGGLVEVQSGLRAGERVISAGTLFIDRAVEGA